MNGDCNHLDRLSDPEAKLHWQIADTFEQNWEATLEPDFEAILGGPLPIEEPLRSTLLIDLAGADLQFRIEQGLPVDVLTHYINRYPGVDACRVCVLDLFETEYRSCRESNGTKPEIFLQRVPEALRD